MARLSHSNIIAVHDVGRIEDEVFCAMELVDGGSLRKWLETKRSQRDIVQVFIQAGLGVLTMRYYW